MHQIILFLEFGYFGLWRTHLQNYKFWRPLLRAGTLTSQSFLFIFDVNYEQKWQLKVCADARAICSTGFLFCTELFLNTKPLQKKHVPLKLGQLWLCQTFYSASCVVVCVSLNVNIFVPRLILNLNMFYKTVKCIRIKYLKSRKFFASWVWVPLKMGNMAFCLFLRP